MEQGEESSEPSEPASEEGTSTSSSSLLGLIFGGSPAYAQSVAAPEVSNPAIRKIIDSRTARAAEVLRLKKLGVVGEDNQAHLAARDLAKLGNLKARAAAQKLIKAENRDREALFREIAKAKGVGEDQLGRIRETYAKAIRGQAKPGEWIQSADGSWKQR